MSWIGHLDLDAFFARCEELRNPELEGKPVVICVYTRGGSSGAVSTSNYEARELGIGSGMPLAEARKKASEETVFLPVDRDFYRRKSKQVVSVIRSHSREVQKVSVDEAYFRLKNRPVKKAKKMKAEVESLGLSCSIGIADNKFVAKMASEEDKPDGLTKVGKGDEENFLKDKAVEKLHGVGGKTAKKLEELGIENCGDLLEKNDSILVEKFGRERTASLKSRARGRGSKSLESGEQKQLSKIRTMEKNSSDYRYIREELREASGELRLRLEKKDLAFSKVALILIDAELDTYTRSKKIKTSTGEELFGEADEILRDFLEDSGPEVRRIGVRVSGLVDTGRQTSLASF